MRRIALLLVLAAGSAAAQNQYLLVTDAAEDTVRKYALDGTYLGTVFESGAGGLDQPLGLTVAPDGSLLVSGDLTGKVHQYDMNTGESLGIFAEADGMIGPAGITIHAGMLWASDGRSGAVYRFNADTGELVDRFIEGMRVPEAVMFDGAGNVIVGDWLTSEFRVYDETTGDFERQIVRNNGLARPLHAEISAGGDSILAVNFFGNTLTEHDIESGELIRSVDLRANGAPMSGPVDWITLDDGSHIVSSTNTGTLLKYDADWSYVGVFATGNATRAGAMVLVPAPASITVLPVMLISCRRRR